MRARIRYGGIAVPVLLAACALAACGSRDKPVDGASAIRAQAALDAAQELSDQERAAEEKLIRRCMIKKGFTVFPARSPAKERAKATGLISPTPDAAKTSGYGLDPRLRGEVEAKEDNSAWENLPDSEKGRFTLAKYGPDRDVVRFEFKDGAVSVPRTGCVGDVTTALFGDLKEYIRLSETATNRIGHATSARLEKDANLKKALGAWGECMKKTEFAALTTPDSARNKAATYYERIGIDETDRLDRARTSEVAIAVADAQCGEQTRLNEASTQARAKAMGKALVEHEAEITAWRDLVEKALKKAQQMLNQP